MAGNTKKRTGKLKMKTPQLPLERNAFDDSLRHERERQEDMVGDHLMENTYEPNPEQLEDDATSSSSEDDIQWVNVELEPPRPIDLAIEACKEKFRREARELNWNNVTQLLHPAFMTMKSRTNNWSRTLDINPMPKCRNYKKSFFKQQWASQREFRHHRTGPEDERRCKLVELYEKEATVARLRKELSSPKVLQRTEDELADLIENIETGTEEVQLLKEELTEEEGVHIDDKEQRLLLLLWSAKTELFLQASYKQAEMQPITDSQTIGTRLGTKGREKVFQALRDRESVVARALNLYNKRYTDYVAEYPDKAPATQYEHPLSYDEFSAFPLDDAFWNDGIYYQSKEPWAMDPNVRSGINCVLILSRIQEEFQLIAQELARMVEWAISHYHTLFKSINYLRGRIVQMSIPNTAVPPDYIDEIPFGDGKCSRVLKVTYIKQDLQQRTWEHGTLVEEWSEKMVRTHKVGPTTPSSAEEERGIKEVGLELDHLQEDTVLDERVNDGEDAASQFLANRGEVDPLAQINGVHV
ncbi:hypothetical protein KEM48_009699 [Puccinia striiformis f. sp. tritici PST-130]|nr:hypothetical protein KEM48_009699 [Puccinia striiformis f. sp. tritici PST-130]